MLAKAGNKLDVITIVANQSSINLNKSSAEMQCPCMIISSRVIHVQKALMWMLIASKISLHTSSLSMAGLKLLVFLEV